MANRTPKFVKEFSVLIVEDQPIIAFDLETTLVECGARDVVIAGSVRRALDILSERTFDVAFLDLQIGVDMSFEVASELSRAGIPFAFSTGLDPLAVLPAEHQSRPVMTKPYADGEVLKILGELLKVRDGETVV